MEKTIWDNITELLGNYMILSAAIAWFVAQIVKVIDKLIREKKLDLKLMVKNGGMPSGHSATIIAASTAAAISYGLNSGVFAICIIIAIVIMTDAVGVRWQTGQQSKVINILRRGKEEGSDIKLKEVMGHTVAEIVVGSVVGFAVAVAYAAIYYAVAGHLPIMA